MIQGRTLWQDYLRLIDNMQTVKGICLVCSRFYEKCIRQTVLSMIYSNPILFVRCISLLPLHLRPPDKTYLKSPQDMCILNIAQQLYFSKITVCPSWALLSIPNSSIKGS
jgi:hypothetical protein